MVETVYNSVLRAKTLMGKWLGSTVVRTRQLESLIEAAVLVLSPNKRSPFETSTYNNLIQAKTRHVLEGDRMWI